MKRDDFAQLLDERLAPLKAELNTLGGRVSGLSAELAEMGEQVATKRDVKALEGKLTEFFNYLDGVHAVCQFREYRSLIAGARADLQNDFCASHISQVGHQRDDVRL